jgi:hypothetical protein
MRKCHHDLTSLVAVRPRFEGLARCTRLIHSENQVSVKMTPIDFEGAY